MDVIIFYLLKIDKAYLKISLDLFKIYIIYLNKPYNLFKKEMNFSSLQFGIILILVPIF